MLHDSRKPPYAQPYTGNAVQAQPVSQAQNTGTQPGQQPQVVYAQPVTQGPPVVQAQPVNQLRPETYTVVERRYQRNATYCGPITLILAILMFWFIGPFVLFFFLCPCDEVPQETITREYRQQGNANYV